jgi:hypothetical protein
MKGVLLIFRQRPQQRPDATSDKGSESDEQQVKRLHAIDELRFRKPMLYPLSYEGARA